MDKGREKLLIFTGAGFSKALSSKLPITREMLEQAVAGDGVTNLDYFQCFFNHSNDMDVETLAKTISNCLESVKQLTSCNYKNPHTSVIGDQPSDGIGNKLRRLRDDWQKSLSHINQQVFNQLIDVELDDGAEEKFRKLITKLDEKYIFNIVTANYDTAIRQLQNKPRYYLNDYNIVDIQKIIKRGTKLYRYIPLKGMLDWRFKDQGRKVIVEGLKPANDINDSVMMTLEDVSKYEDLQYPHREFYDTFKKLLGEAERLLVIGFSFRDDIIGDLIQQQIKQNTKIQKIAIINQETADSQALRDLKEKIHDLLIDYKGERYLDLTSGFDISNPDKIFNIEHNAS